MKIRCQKQHPSGYGKTETPTFIVDCSLFGPLPTCDHVLMEQPCYFHKAGGQTSQFPRLPWQWQGLMGLFYIIDEMACEIEMTYGNKKDTTRGTWLAFTSHEPSPCSRSPVRALPILNSGFCMTILIECENITNVRSWQLPLRFLYYTNWAAWTTQSDHQLPVFILQAHGLVHATVQE